ncbi:serine hydrolase domain-containing protein [Sciscionella sediminilitoris]|uniref:serine hydrolase domain-containing protein n=1 Tax=Sciscionella sediminilitoris TaxID=1445613 RepID=UPI00055F5CA0|nr:serine hydrolase [Sciscionella sp. SE31]
MTFDRRRFLGASLAGVGAVALAGGSATAGNAATGDVPALLRRYLDKGISYGFPGLVCGVLRGGTQYVEGAGRLAGAGSARPDGDTVFQLGSVTKTFTGLMLAEAVERGVVRLDEPVRNRVPWPVPTAQGKEIRLVDLATHSSGLPRLPANIDKVPGFDPLDPYRAITRADLARFLAETKLGSVPGTKFDYSNFGFALLGQALSSRYDQMLRTITVPLGLRDTALCLNPEQRQRKAQGYSQGQAVPDWTGETFAAAGCSAYSTVNDQLRYLGHQLAPESGPFAAAIRNTQKVHFTDPASKVGLGLDWIHGTLPSGRAILGHDGGTGGFSSYALFCPDSGTALAMMGNLAPDAQHPERTVDALAVDLFRELDALP